MALATLGSTRQNASPKDDLHRTWSRSPEKRQSRGDRWGRVVHRYACFLVCRTLDPFRASIRTKSRLAGGSGRPPNSQIDLYMGHEEPGTLTQRAYQRAVEDQIFREIDEENTARPDELKAFFEEIWSETDRAFAIVAHSYMDERTKELFEAALNPEISGGVKSLVGPMQPLGTASARVQVAAGLFWLSKSTYCDATLFRKIRNDFAHKAFLNGLADEQISARLSAMTRYESILCKNPGMPPPESLGAGMLLRLRTLMLAALIVAELSVAPKASRAGLSPLAPLHSGWDRLPKGIKGLWAAVEHVALKAAQGEAR